MNRRAKKTCLFIGIAVALLASLATPKSNSETLVIRGKWVWDGTGKPSIPGGVVLIRGDRIVAVGTGAEVSVPPGALSLDLGDLFLMPGLVNSHEHFSLDQFAGTDEAGLVQLPTPYLALRAARNGRNSLRSGVTTARVPGEKDAVDLQYKRAFNEDLLPGPRLVVAGRFLRPPGGFPNYAGLGPAFSGVDELRRVVRENIGAGADFCKMFISGSGIPVDTTVVDAIYFTKDEIETIVQECHIHGKKVTAHVIKGGPSFDWAVTAGVDAFEHGPLLTREEIQKLKEHDIFLVIGGSRWFIPGGEYAGIAAPEDGEAIVRKWYTTAFAVRPKLAVGVDGFHEPAAMAREVAVLVRYGLTNKEALLVATRNGGELTGLPVGTLEPGKYADIIGIRGNPLENINALQQVNFVMKGGKVFDLSRQ